MTSVYIACPWVRKSDAIEAGQKFKDAGFHVTSRWFDHQGDPNDSAGVSVSDEVIKQQAIEDLQDVLDADVIVVLNLQKSEGKAVETGFALAHGIPLVTVGSRSNIFQVLGTMVSSIEEAIEACRAI
jgi:nucleoside 2-deoxyribosyltransferase